MIYILAALGLIIDIGFIIYDDLKHDYVSIILKTLASLVFVLMGIYFANQKGFSFDSKLIVYCLIADLIGDFILILRNVDTKHKDLIFISGTFAFFIGHFFLIALNIRRNSNVLLTSVIVTAVIFAIMLVPYIKLIKANKTLKIIGAIYLYVISFVFVLALIDYINSPSSFGDIFVFAYYLFLVSDIVLMFSKFCYKDNKILQVLYRLSYYISQVFIAISIINL